MYKSILLPLDLAHDSSWTKALPVAVELAERFGAELHVLTVVPDIRTSMVSQYFPNDFEATATRKAAEALNTFVAEKLSERKVTEHVATGRVFREIVRCAEANGCDLIVMASHRPEMADHLIGPSADQVVRHTDKSVMIVRD
ncbi:universal stress protein [Stappia sp. F7233]|uniref:Universal stress protein n=1 Tax=Stappia albiluteola TaxID=2758565 RepID=A0A839AH97_9HYPH|nr:universal stress protein [Stappia albiluteola]MBA5778282.1 universal stress protein [Stappia albiluteola]